MATKEIEIPIKVDTSDGLRGLNRLEKTMLNSTVQAQKLQDRLELK